MIAGKAINIDWKVRWAFNCFGVALKKKKSSFEAKLTVQAAALKLISQKNVSTSNKEFILYNVRFILQWGGE